MKFVLAPHRYLSIEKQKLVFKKMYYTKYKIWKKKQLKSAQALSPFFINLLLLFF